MHTVNKMDIVLWMCKTNKNTLQEELGAFLNILKPELHIGRIENTGGSTRYAIRMEIDGESSETDRNKIIAWLAVNMRMESMEGECLHVICPYPDSNSNPSHELEPANLFELDYEEVAWIPVEKFDYSASSRTCYIQILPGHIEDKIISYEADIINHAILFIDDFIYDSPQTEKITMIIPEGLPI